MLLPFYIEKKTYDPSESIASLFLQINLHTKICLCAR